jgi:CRP-like cAMP-binding protein
MVVSTPLPSAVALNLHHQFTARSVLPQKQDKLWRIESGVVRVVTWLESGTVVTLGLWGPGDMVGKALSKADPYQVECLTAVEATLFPLDAWQGRAETLLSQVQQTEELLIIRSYRRADVMLVKLLSWLGNRFGRAVDQGKLIDLRLTHQDIAELLGTTRVTITRLFSQLEQQGLIERLPLHRVVLREEEIWHYEI